MSEALAQKHEVSISAIPQALKAPPPASMMEAMMAWDESEYMGNYGSCLDILGVISPALVVVDPMCSHGYDAYTALRQNDMLLPPLSIEDFAGMIQSKLAFFWEYPVLSSAFPFPLPWSLMFPNISLTVRLICCLFSSTRLRMVATWRKKHGLTGTVPCFEPYIENSHYLFHSMLENDYPMIIPQHIKFCGPILLPERPISESDPDLAAWLEKGPTILINLGCHVAFDAADTNKLAKGVRVVLDYEPGIQVLWKINSRGPLSDDLLQLLGQELASGRVRIEDWLTIDPLAILQSGHVTCSVHHRSAKSYYEAIG
ncbi:MAG: hypothetical protein M1827_004851 [Pycnora praestabilis]|nr:MAG: hypothetical protein M1827_004851 [Pycnora praestabilis]